MNQIAVFTNKKLDDLKNQINIWIADCENNSAPIDIISTTHVVYNNEHIITVAWKPKNKE